MKNNKYIVLFLALCIGMISCNEDEFLEEEVFDFYSADNSYVTADQFNAAVTQLYSTTDEYTIWGALTSMFLYQYTSDVAYAANGENLGINSYSNALVPENAYVRIMWQRFYEIIAKTNAILDRIDGEETEFESEAQRTILKAETMFFRGNMYRLLAHQYGGVPLVLEEFSEPKRDFVRATQAEVYAQVISDLEFAAANLPDVSELGDEVRLTNAAAHHLLAEIYNTIGEYDKAIENASLVINNPSYALMTERFGSRADEEGDVYWDLFRRENQNRSAGNTEAIWVAQYEYLATGGGRGSIITQFFGPSYYNLQGDDGVNLFLGPTTQNGGRGIGWFAPSDYLLNGIWEDSDTDMRNSEYNIIRDLVVDNEDSPYFGQYIVANNLIRPENNLYNKNWTAIFSKTTVANNFPEELFVDESTGEVTRNAASTFRDHYHIRLAETYLLRAEAYLGAGNTSAAADDINMIRARVNAPLISAADVDVDFLLDERSRELLMEEYRTLTLKRMGKLVEKVQERNPWYNGTFDSSAQIYDYHALWPIPQQEIERNTEAVLEQNPGYSN
ncbi:RagB/SusD family nutrient uptake outer membrane protein [uncultured Kriegella sp.]|uniref:RagB/SusD family nutrient uptake outer membrane protein n=1 Tax=uncultured Kriegella sp. TaxID=1798910 RepID=UPI0030D91124|tara:strand:- start:106336 stop:108015 length:1680 start_codon:yes stop_codon:yes gene_type:complete